MFRKFLFPVGAVGLLGAAFIGCKGDECDSDDPSDTDCPQDNTCQNSYVAFPAPAATNVFYRTTVEAKFQTLPASYEIAIDGVTGETSVRGNSVVFTPSSGLAPSTSYTVNLTYDCNGSNQESSWTFTTGAVGSAVTGDLTGRTYVLDLQSGRFVEPEGVGSLLSEYLTTDVLVGVDSVGTGTIQMIGAIGVEGATPPAQDTCNATIPFPEASFADNPFFQVGPEQTTITVEDFAITIDDLVISGAFAPDGTYIAGAVLAGSIDTYPLATLLAPDCVEGDDTYPDCLDGICDMAGGMGIDCEMCEGQTSGTPHCLSIYVDSITAEELNETSLVEIASQEEACLRSECAADPDCMADTDTDTQ